MTGLFKKIEKIYNLSMFPFVGILLYLFFESVGFGNSNYRLIALIISIIFLISSEMYYFSMTREDLERRFSIIEYLTDKHRRFRVLYKYIINDGKAMVLTIGFIYCLHIFLTGRFMPFEVGFLQSIPNLFAYFWLIVSTSTAPMSVKLRKEKLESIEIEIFSANKTKELNERADKIRKENEFLYSELNKQAMEENEIVIKEAEFQQKAEETKSVKMEILKILLGFGLSLI